MDVTSTPVTKSPIFGIPSIAAPFLGVVFLVAPFWLSHILNAGIGILTSISFGAAAVSPLLGLARAMMALRRSERFFALRWIGFLINFAVGAFYLIHLRDGTLFHITAA